jgi:outer membrane protein TolC
LNFRSIEWERSAEQSLKAADHNYRDARELVILAVGNAYLQAMAGASRVEAAVAQVATAQALFNKASDQQKAGVSPAIDTLRAQVERKLDSSSSLSLPGMILPSRSWHWHG